MAWNSSELCPAVAVLTTSVRRIVLSYAHGYTYARSYCVVLLSGLLASKLLLAVQLRAPEPIFIVLQVTLDAIKRFQSAAGLVGDGVVGPQTKQLLTMMGLHNDGGDAVAASKQVAEVDVGGGGVVVGWGWVGGGDGLSGWW